MSREGCRLLCLAPFPPRRDAAHGGARVMAELLVRLAERHPLALLHLRAEGEPPADELLVARCALVEEFPRPVWRPSRRRLRRLRKGVRALASAAAGRPLWARFCASPALARRLAELAPAFRPDVVQLEYHVMGQYLAALDGCPARRVLDQYEPGAAAARDIWRAARGTARLEARLDLAAWRRFERSLTRRLDAVVVFTERDRRAMRESAPGARLPIVIIPPGAPGVVEPPSAAIAERPDTAAKAARPEIAAIAARPEVAVSQALPALPVDTASDAPPADPAGAGERLLFVGNFHHPPNVEAAERLARAIFPAVRARHPGAALDLVGEAPPERLRALAGNGVAVTGRVASVEPYLRRAALVVAPLRLGGGMRVKVLEALAAGKALVATGLAVEGLAIEDGREYVRAESDADFAGAIAALLADPERRAALAGRARAWAAAYLGWEGTVAAYQALYGRLLGRAV